MNTDTDCTNNAYEASKIALMELQNIRESLELEAETITTQLNSTDAEGRPPLGVNTPLIDSEGFPLAGYDLFAIRSLRHKLACIQTDHKEIMKKIEAALHNLHAVESTKSNAASKSASSTTSTIMEQNTYSIEQTNFPPRVPFAVVNSVANGSPAAECGLREGDKILSFGNITYMNHSYLRNVSELVRTSEDMAITVWIERHQKLQRISLVPKSWSGQGLLGCHLLPV